MVLDSMKHFVMSTLGERVRQRLRVRLYASMLRQEIGFFDTNSKGSVRMEIQTLGASHPCA